MEKDIPKKKIDKIPEKPIIPVNRKVTQGTEIKNPISILFIFFSDSEILFITKEDKKPTIIPISEEPTKITTKEIIG